MWIDLEENGCIAMNLRQAYKILELSENASMPEVKQAYRDLVQIWHPDRYLHNERLQRKALEKMKELNAAYDSVCLHLVTKGAEGFTDKEPKYEASTETTIACPHCGTKNRARSAILSRKINFGNNILGSKSLPVCVAGQVLTAPRQLFILCISLMNRVRARNLYS